MIETTKIMAEVTAVENDKALVVPFDHLSDVGVGCKVGLIAKSNVIYPDNSWLGRVLDAKARPLDKGGELITGEKKYSLQSQALPAYNRKLGYEKLDLGIRSLNIFSPCCYGQRMGIFAGSGVGKSILLSMISKFSTADVKIIGLIGERDRSFSW